MRTETNRARRTSASKQTSQIWKIYARQPSGKKDSRDYAAECFSQGVIAVGWNKVGDLNKFDSRIALKKLFTRIEGKNKSEGEIEQQVSALWNYGSRVNKGDMVICPDRESDCFYVGTVLSSRAFYDDSSLGGKCNFAHRRRVRWERRKLRRSEIQHLSPDGRLGGRQTVSKVKIAGGAGRIYELLAKGRHKRGHPQILSQPDMEWGRAAEERAMQWLRSEGYKPVDVANLHVGWDITCGDRRFEVKGRKSSKAGIRLTQNEWRTARKFRSKYEVLVFTARSLEKLKGASPRRIADPTNTEAWMRRITFEYLLVE